MTVQSDNFVQRVGCVGLGEDLLISDGVGEVGFGDLEGEKLFEDKVGLMELLLGDKAVVGVGFG